MQETNLYTITIPPMIKALKALSVMLDRAEAHAATKASEWLPTEKQMSALLNDRLIFDQFALVRQIQIASDNAKGAAARLAEIEIPKYEDTEATADELRARLAKTIAFLESIKPEQIIDKEALKVTISYYPGKYMTGFDYVTHHALPNFFFHFTTAYSILRKNGVNIGKSDFTGNLPLQDL